MRPNRSTTVVKKFNGKVCDVLVVYCTQHDTLQYFLASDLDGRSSLNIKPE